jgi:ABC-type transport system involved in cytochrome bd biosynthesis fused ATPase/permease subunit
LPNPRTQTILGWLSVAGVLLACSACGLLWQNQLNAGLIAFVLADLILIPAFVLLLRTRRRTKQVVRQLEEVQQEQLDALAGLGDMAPSTDKKDS